MQKILPFQIPFARYVIGTSTIINTDAKMPHLQEDRQVLKTMSLVGKKLAYLFASINRFQKFSETRGCVAEVFQWEGVALGSGRFLFTEGTLWARFLAQVKNDVIPKT